MREDAECSATYGSVAEIKGLSETPTRETYAEYDLIEKGSEEAMSSIAEITKGLVGTFETIEQ